MASTFSFFTTKEIKPRGWLRRQLEIQADGLNGNLDKVWPDVRDSMWIGGSCEGWERVPYWLDGFIPLAYLLDDEDKKARAQKYIDKIIEFQKPDGWICPNGKTPIEKYDTWAILLLTKVLVVYHDCTGDERVPGVVYRTMKNFYDYLSAGTLKLFAWGQHRWYEGFIALNWLKERFPNEEWIDGLARIFREQGTDYEQLTDLWKAPQNKWTQDTHIVNMVMMLKSEAVSCDLLGEDYTDLAERLYSVLRTYNGSPVGLINGDECLAGNSPIQGAELCSVVELMYSFEHLYAKTGDKKWAERLERVAFNALPATISDDMWSHQYDQLSNQIDCTPIGGNPIFTTNGKDAHIFGLEPEFGCCTSNFGQGWPKLALSAFMKAEDGVVCSVALPSELTTEWRGAKVKVTLDTEYPFKNTFVYRVESDRRTAMKLKIRIPSFAKHLRVNGEPKTARGWVTVGGFAAGVTEIRISFETEAHLEARPYRLYNVSCGSLVFSVPVRGEATMKEYTKSGVERKFPYCDYHIRGTSDWNYAFADRTFTVEEREVSDVPFSSEKFPVVLKAKMCHIPWGSEPRFEKFCAKVPNSRVPLDEPQLKELAPYGCAKLRMTEMPLIREK